MKSRSWLTEEFDRQIENLIQKRYWEISGMTRKELTELLEPLKEKISELTLPAADLEEGTLPFVIVIKSTLVDSDKAMAQVTREGKEGLTKLYPLTPLDFHPIDNLIIPNSQAYLLVDIDRGKETRSVRPMDALIRIYEENRSPLTIDEGIAIITHFPEFLIKNNCFSLLGSRHSGDQRVPALWINAEKRPNLGWCWDGNPHTWLGSASSGKRIGI